MATLNLYEIKLEFDDTLKYGCLTLIPPLSAFSPGGYEFLKKAGFTPPKYQFIEFPINDFQDSTTRLSKKVFLSHAKRLIDVNTWRLEDSLEDPNTCGEDRVACENTNGLVQRMISALQNPET